MYRKSFCTIHGVSVGISRSVAKCQSFCVMGKALSGELSCLDRSCYSNNKELMKVYLLFRVYKHIKIGI